MKFPISNFQFYKFVGILALLFLLLSGGYKCYRYFNPKHIPLPPRPETTITIIPGWDLRDIAKYFEKQGIVSTTKFYEMVGQPAYDYRSGKIDAPVLDFFEDKIANNRNFENKPDFVSFEGWLAPDTYRIYKDATLKEIIAKLINQRDKEFTDYYNANFEKVPDHNFYDVLTMASILEKEVRNFDDKKLVADIFWRRYDKNWALQADSTVHYALGKEGDVFTTAKDRQTNSLWNTYKYPSLPPSPICNPGLDSIKAVISPTPNKYWYFLTSSDGVVHYAKTLDEHNMNRIKFLK